MVGSFKIKNIIRENNYKKLKKLFHWFEEDYKRRLGIIKTLSTSWSSKLGKIYWRKIRNSVTRRKRISKRWSFIRKKWCTNRVMNRVLYKSKINYSNFVNK